MLVKAVSWATYSCSPCRHRLERSVCAIVWTLAQIFTADWMSEVAEHIPVLVFRTLVSFLFVMMIVRWTGKRSIANLAPFDLAMVIMIGEVAAIPISDLKVDFLHGILPVAMIGGLHVLMTTVNMHSKPMEKLTEGEPTLLVKDGRILKQNLLKERVSMADLFTALRHKEVDNVAEVKEAWIEHAGGISVILADRAAPASPVDVERAVERVLARRLEPLVRESVTKAVDEALLQTHLPPRTGEESRQHPGG